MVKSAVLACTWCRSAVMIMHQQSLHLCLSYLDNLIGVSPLQTAAQAYQLLHQFLNSLGLMENLDKACPPLTKQVVLGVLIISISTNCLKSLFLLRLNRKSTRKHNLQSLIDKLSNFWMCLSIPYFCIAG